MISLVLLTIFATQVYSNEKSYEDQLSEVIEQVKKKENLQEISKSVESLVESSKPVLKKVSSSFSVCNEQLSQLMSEADQMARMGRKEFGQKYHQGSGSEEHAFCHHAKDLLVHPVSVIIMTKDKIKSSEVYDKMQAELLELKSHLQVVQAKLKEKAESSQ